MYSIASRYINTTLSNQHHMRKTLASISILFQKPTSIIVTHEQPIQRQKLALDYAYTHFPHCIACSAWYRLPAVTDLGEIA